MRTYWLIYDEKNKYFYRNKSWNSGFVWIFFFLCIIVLSSYLFMQNRTTVIGTSYFSLNQDLYPFRYEIDNLKSILSNTIVWFVDTSAFISVILLNNLSFLLIKLLTKLLLNFSWFSFKYVWLIFYAHLLIVNMVIFTLAIYPDVWVWKIPLSASPTLKILTLILFDFLFACSL